MRQRYALGPRSRTAGGGGSGERRARALCSFKKLLSVVRESAGPKILGHGDLM
jgi:hypothetical protein